MEDNCSNCGGHGVLVKESGVVSEPELCDCTERMDAGLMYRKMDNCDLNTA
jgi:hypothetical protein